MRRCPRPAPHRHTRRKQINGSWDDLCGAAARKALARTFAFSRASTRVVPHPTVSASGTTTGASAWTGSALLQAPLLPNCAGGGRQGSGRVGAPHQAAPTRMPINLPPWGPGERWHRAPATSECCTEPGGGPS